MELCSVHRFILYTKLLVKLNIKKHQILINWLYVVFLWHSFLGRTSGGNKSDEILIEKNFA